MTDNRMALTILGGWLGAGKTPWLRHRLHTGLAAHVIVNEAAGVAVDDALLQRPLLLGDLLGRSGRSLAPSRGSPQRG